MSKATGTATPKVAKGTQTSEKILGTAANSLSISVKQFKEAASAVEKFEETINGYVLKVSDLEDKLRDLGTQYEQEKATQTFNIKLEYDTNRKAFADKFLEEKGCISVVKADYNCLVDDLTKLKVDFNTKLAAEVAKEKAIQENRMKNETRLAQLEATAASATLTAEGKQKDQHIAVLEKQILSLQKEVESQRQLTAEVAKSGAIGTLNLGDQGRK